MQMRAYTLLTLGLGGVMFTLDRVCPVPDLDSLSELPTLDSSVLGIVCWVAFPGIGIASVVFILLGLTLFLYDKAIRPALREEKTEFPKKYLTRQHWDLSRVLAHISYASRQGWATRRRVLLAHIASWFAVKTFNDGARLQSLRAQGRPRAHAVYEDVDPSYWRSAKVADVEALTPSGVITRTEPRGFYVGGIRHYDDFLFREEDVLAIWPPAPLWLRCWSWLVIVTKRVWLELAGLAQMPVRAMWRYWRRRGRI